MATLKHTSPSVLVVGATGGIGAALCNIYARTIDARAPNSPPQLFATHRPRVKPVSEGMSKGDVTNNLLDNRNAPAASLTQHAPVTWIEFDYTQPETFEALKHTLTSTLSALDTLVIATGLLHNQTLAPEKSLDALSETGLDTLFRVNASGPLLLLKTLQPLLRAARQPRIAVLSAQVGSIEDNHLGGWYSYRMAKAALNMGLKTASIELARWKNTPTVVAVHPGTTHSELSKPFVSRRRAPIQTAEQAGAKLHALVQSLSPERSGQFLRLDGSALPW